MNPCDCFKPPEFRVRTDTEIHGSCNCCRDNICQSQCGLCCFPFFRRRNRTDCEERTQHIYENKIKEQESLSYEDTSMAAQGRSITIGRVEREREEGSKETRAEDQCTSDRGKSKRKKAKKKEVLLRQEQRSGRDARHRLPKDAR